MNTTPNLGLLGLDLMQLGLDTNDTEMTNNGLIVLRTVVHERNEACTELHKSSPCKVPGQAMTVKHSTPEWRRTVRIVRAQTRAAWQRGEEVTCWRHGHVLDPEQPYDVGHLDPNGGEGVDNAAPECRRGNRSHRGKLGAARTNATRSTKSTFVPLPWA